MRKVQIVLTRNLGGGQGEFDARIFAHAQVVSRRGQEIVRQDEDVMPFTAHWVFGRRDGEWKLKQADPDCVPA